MVRNQLTSLPESVGNIDVGGSFNLANNKLTSLPVSIGNIKVKEILELATNQLISFFQFIISLAENHRRTRKTILIL